MGTTVKTRDRSHRIAYLLMLLTFAVALTTAQVLAGERNPERKTTISLQTNTVPAPRAICLSERHPVLAADGYADRLHRLPCQRRHREFGGTVRPPLRWHGHEHVSNARCRPQGPYAVCAKCHDLNSIMSMSNTNWTQPSLHVSQYGFSCSVCHTSHGMGAVNPSVSGERLVNFDISVVGQNQTAPISHTRASNTCALTCHNAAHNADAP